VGTLSGVPGGDGGEVSFYLYLASETD